MGSKQSRLFVNVHARAADARRRRRCVVAFAGQPAPPRFSPCGEANLRPSQKSRVVYLRGSRAPRVFARLIFASSNNKRILRASRTPDSARVRGGRGQIRLCACRRRRQRRRRRRRRPRNTMDHAETSSRLTFTSLFLLVFFFHFLYSCQSACDLRRRIRVSVPAIFIRTPSLLSARSPLDHRI